MRTFTIFNIMFGLELQCKWSDLDNWMIDTMEADRGTTRLYWFGPLHFGITKLAYLSST